MYSNCSPKSTAMSFRSPQIFLLCSTYFTESWMTIMLAKLSFMSTASPIGIGKRWLLLWWNTAFKLRLEEYVSSLHSVTAQQDYLSFKKKEANSSDVDSITRLWHHVEQDALVVVLTQEVLPSPLTTLSFEWYRSISFNSVCAVSLKSRMWKIWWVLLPYSPYSELCIGVGTVKLSECWIGSIADGRFGYWTVPLIFIDIHFL